MDSKIKIMGYAVLGLYFVGMLAIGYFCNKKYANNVDGFFAGGKNLGPWVFALTYGSTYLSSSTFVGNTATAYSGGLAYLFMPLAQMLLLPLGLIFFSHILRKMSQSLDVVTIPAYLEKRFKSPAAGMITSLIIVIFFIPYLVGIVKASALSLGALLGVEYKIGVLVIAFISFVYLMFGGYMARCYTDVVQGVMMVVGMMAVVIAGFFIVGGPSAITEGVKAADPALLETPGPKGWSALFLYSTGAPCPLRSLTSPRRQRISAVRKSASCSAYPPVCSCSLSSALWSAPAPSLSSDMSSPTPLLSPA